MSQGGRHFPITFRENGLKNSSCHSPLTLLGAWLLGYIQTHEPVLQWVANESSPFVGKDGNTSIYSGYIYNVGNKEAEDVVWVIHIPKAKYDQEPKFIKPDAVELTKEIKEDEIRVRLKKFNPGPPIGIQVLASSKEPLPSKPLVSLVGAGVNGVEVAAVNPSKSPVNTNSLFAIFLGLMVAGVSMILMNRQEQITKTESAEREKERERDRIARELEYEQQKKAREEEAQRQKEVEAQRYRYKIRIRQDGVERIVIRVLEGTTASEEEYTIVPGMRHARPMLSYSELKALGEGEHLVSSH